MESKLSKVFPLNKSAWADNVFIVVWCLAVLVAVICFITDFGKELMP